MARPSKYTPEFRRRAIEEVLDRERTVTEVARALSITTPELAIKPSGSVGSSG